MTELFYHSVVKFGLYCLHLSTNVFLTKFPSDLLCRYCADGTNVQQAKTDVLEVSLSKINSTLCIDKKNFLPCFQKYLFRHVTKK